ncbi:predicted protein [Postia placenta Mad-698-R]|uniref:Mre11 DNA-binding domain-containing protein n=1 Tax=Postia placenta MAD-698-R-SB12 TaxID=670580 RepID=A0A1X6NHZ6_9APHY|nr:hypothetical protein POSPLADRAFT_1129222 [Postia placenta MAD-698-R-SB12]EED85777.1 predicted protein [Postia placenta Mad-698-R]OSX68172.1 hypothetical protein POSPLADRAFT_1129222 [Postia placenta MAD-698-R-SB12]
MGSWLEVPHHSAWVVCGDVFCKRRINKEARCLAEMKGNEFELTPTLVRAVRPFVLDEAVLTEVTDDGNLNYNDRRLSLILSRSESNVDFSEKVTALMDERCIGGNALHATGRRSETPPDRLTPLAQEFQGCLTNARIVLVYYREKATARRGAKIMTDQAEPSIDKPEFSFAEGLSKVRVQTPIREYPAMREPQLLGEPCMPDAIEAFVDKEDIFSIQKSAPTARSTYKASGEGT